MSAGSQASIVRVLICDDSAVVRTVLVRALSGDPGIAVVGQAHHGQQAVAAVTAGGIDVVVLDIEMPVMDGMTALPLLLVADRSVKVLMSSSLTTRGAAIALEALRLGAADFMAKPSAAAGMSGEQTFQAEMLAKVRGLGRQAQARRAIRSGQPAMAANAPAQSGIKLRRSPVQRADILAIGSSTGGPAALLSLFRALGPRVGVPIVVTQHMPPAFTAQLASHINRLGACSCAEARHGETLRAGHIHLAPGDRHLKIVPQNGQLVVALSDDPPENFCRPSVDPMLRSLAPLLKGRILVAMLTGMGQDGLAGAQDVIEAGGGVLAQDEASSVVWGMPGAVAKAGLCHAVLPLDELAPAISRALTGFQA
jgi:two-component system chemotaxis response regulator CheB